MADEPEPSAKATGSMSNMGKWDTWYKGIDPNLPQPYGDEFSYSRGAQFLADCEIIEDWGCGKGGFRPWCPVGALYIGIDGSLTPFAHKIVDLAVYRSSTDGIFMRHVLEHDERWPHILRNAAASFQSKMVLITFTPETENTKTIGFCDEIGVPDIAFRREDLLEILTRERVMVTVESHCTASQYGVEQIFCCTKQQGL